MGDQVNIADLAENMIRMAGKVPHDEIEIQSPSSVPARSCTRGRQLTGVIPEEQESGKQAV